MSEMPPLTEQENNMAQWVMDPLRGNMMRRGTTKPPVKADVDTLAREAGQNSRDQPAGKGPIKVRYSLIELSGKHKAQFLDAMDWPGLKEHLEACTKEPGATGPRLQQGLEIVAGDKPLRCLRIEDFGTRGLEGDDFTDKNKNFCLLCRAEFKTSSVGGRGGSHGVGKAVLWGLSEIGTVLVSSVVHGWERKGLRIFGRTDIPNHTIKGVEYENSGWFGAKKTRASDNTEFAESIFGDNKLAEVLLLDRAHSPGTGTSVLIVGFYEPDQDEERSIEDIAADVLASAERWFWPSISGSKPSMEVEVTAERNGRETFAKKAIPSLTWAPFIRARDAAATGATAKTPDQIAETAIAFKVPAKDRPPEQAHPEFSTSLKLRVTRGDEALAEHERANCVAVFRGAEMVVKYVPAKRKPLDNMPFFGVLLAGTAAGAKPDNHKAEEFFRASEPAMHNEWEFSESVKHSYKKGARQRLANLWNALQENVFALIDENVVPEERGPDLLAKLFPFGHSHKPQGAKQEVKTRITSTTYLGGKWKIEGEVTRTKPNTKPWEVRIGFVAGTDSGSGEYLKVARLVTKDRRAAVGDLGPPAKVTAQGSIDQFEFEAFLDPPASLRRRDLDLTAIRFSH
jgi:hypothetical protein